MNITSLINFNQENTLRELPRENINEEVQLIYAEYEFDLAAKVILFLPGHIDN